MQKYNEPCINTSNFARLCNTNKRTLIHYDEIGLFKPSYTDERGYRYYSETQCDIFFTITCLKDLGMPLKEIKPYVNNKNPDALVSLLHEQQKKVQQELLHLKRIEQVIHNKLGLLSEGQELLFDEDGCSIPCIKEYEEEYFVTTPYLGTSEHEELFSALCEHIGQINHQMLNIGHPYGAMMKVSDLQAGLLEHYAYFMTKVSDTVPNCLLHTKPAGSYALIYLRGDYYKADKAFQKLLGYMEKEKLTPGEYCYKEAVWDELTVERDQEFITRISIPVLTDNHRR